MYDGTERTNERTEKQKISKWKVRADYSMSVANSAQAEAMSRETARIKEIKCTEWTTVRGSVCGKFYSDLLQSLHHLLRTVKLPTYIGQVPNLWQTILRTSMFALLKNESEQSEHIIQFARALFRARFARIILPNWLQISNFIQINLRRPRSLIYYVDTGEA